MDIFAFGFLILSFGDNIMDHVVSGQMVITGGQNSPCSSLGNLCLNGGTCVNHLSHASMTSSYICICPRGFSGDHCERSSGFGVQKNNNYCAVNRNPCLNAGICVDRSSRPSIISWYVCDCPSATSGDHCEFKDSGVQKNSNYCSVNRNPCLNGGICVDRSSRPSIISWYVCDCPPRTAGDHCEFKDSGEQKNNNYCAVNRNPCLNGGTCVDRLSRPSIISWYVCDCPSGMSGDHCEFIDSIDQKNNYCAVNRNPCLNGGTCVDRLSRPSIISWYVCDCPYGMSGDHCEFKDFIDRKNNNYCAVNRNPCLNGGTCVDRLSRPSIISWYVCDCPSGMSGDHCEFKDSMDQKNNNYCAVNRNPCLNGGTCVDRLSRPSIISWYVCDCPYGMSGDHCEFKDSIDQKNNYCAVNRNPCLNGGTCVDRLSRPLIISWYVCDCPSGMSGDHCEFKDHGEQKNNNYCTVNRNPCLNGGACIDRLSRPSIISWYVCDCPSGMSGDHCEFKGSRGTRNYYCAMNENPCLNGGLCVDRSIRPTLISWYICDCPTQYSGDHCELKGEASVGHYCEQNSKLCLNNGVCIDKYHDSTVDLYECKCQNGYTGDHCHIPSGIKFNSATGFCVKYSITCLNGGYCVDETIDLAVSSYRCQCPLGCTGQICQNCQSLGHQSRQSPPCEENPCQNGGTCIDLSDTSICYCPPGCSGYHCQTCTKITDVSDSNSVCDPNPCLKDCSCLLSCNRADGYYCQSRSGFLGKNCTIPAPTLVCGTNNIVISVSQEFVLEYNFGVNNGFLILSQSPDVQSSSCIAKSSTDGYYSFSLTLPFNGCGTTSQTLENGDVLFENTVWYNKVLSGGFDVPIPAAHFECTYARQYEVVTSLKPVAVNIMEMSDTLEIEPVLTLCKSPSCPNECPSHLNLAGGAVYTVGEYLHLTLDTNKQNGEFVSTVEELYLDCSADGSSDTGFYLVRDNCEAKSGIPFHITSVGHSSSVCVSFAVPDLGCSTFFIKASMRMCKRTELKHCASFDNKYCHDETAVMRRRRWTLKDEMLVVGPIYMVVNATFGSPEIQMYSSSSKIKSLSPKISLNGDVLLSTTSTGGEISTRPGERGSNFGVIATITILFILIVVALSALAARRKAGDMKHIME